MIYAQKCQINIELRQKDVLCLLTEVENEITPMQMIFSN